MTPPAWGVHAALGAGRIAAGCLVVGLVFLAIEGSLAVDVSGGVFKLVLNMNKNRRAALACGMRPTVRKRMVID